MKNFYDYLEAVQTLRNDEYINEGIIDFDSIKEKIENFKNKYGKDTLQFSVAALMVLAIALGYTSFKSYKVEQILSLPAKERDAKIEQMRQFVKERKNQFSVGGERALNDHYQMILKDIDKNKK